jgi:hypothetical protein
LFQDPGGGPGSGSQGPYQGGDQTGGFQGPGHGLHPGSGPGGGTQGPSHGQHLEGPGGFEYFPNSPQAAGRTRTESLHLGIYFFGKLFLFKFVNNVECTYI